MSDPCDIEKLLWPKQRNSVVKLSLSLQYPSYKMIKTTLSIKRNNSRML